MLTLLAQTGRQAAESGVPTTPYPLVPQPALIILAIALMIGWGFYRLANIELLERFRPGLLTGLVVFWGMAIVEATFFFAHTLTYYWLPLGLVVLGVVAITNLAWMRNVMAAIQIAFEDRFGTGDSIRVDSVEGEVVDLGLRATRIRRVDGQIHEIPNQTLTTDAVTNLTGHGDCACELTVTIPAEMSIDRARRLARDAALMTPLASPRHSPEVFTTADDPAGGTVRLKIRGYAFDPTYQEHYRSDVTARLVETFENG